MTDALHDRLADALREEVYHITSLDGYAGKKSMEALAAYERAKAAPAEPRSCCRIAVDSARQRWLACGDTARQEMVDGLINAKSEARMQRERAEAAEQELAARKAVGGV